MRTIFDGLILSHYGQAYVRLDDDRSDGTENYRAGQMNGLLGAAQPTMLFLTFGLHTGDVHLTVRLTETEPALCASWEEVVEASFRMPEYGSLALNSWDGSVGRTIPLEPGTHRVRYCARHFGSGEECTRGYSFDRLTETYELTFWPAPHARDSLIRVTSSKAQHWHDVAQGRAH